MTELEPANLDLLSEALGAIPAPVRVPLYKAIGALLGGLTAIPAAKLQQYAQGIDDTTNARSAAAQALVAATIRASEGDPILLQAAAEIYIPTALRKAKNRLRISQKSIKLLIPFAQAVTISSETA